MEAAAHKAVAVRLPTNKSWKLSKLDKTDMWDTTGEVGMSS